jgi:hypothetical protein
MVTGWPGLRPRGASVLGRNGFAGGPETRFPRHFGANGKVGQDHQHIIGGVNTGLPGASRGWLVREEVAGAGRVASSGRRAFFKCRRYRLVGEKCSHRGRCAFCQQLRGAGPRHGKPGGRVVVPHGAVRSTMVELAPGRKPRPRGRQ